MDRQVALILTFVFFIVFALITYYGAQVSAWSSVIFAIFVALILLNIFYPPSQLTSDQADVSLVVYALVEIIGVIILAIYITQRTLSDIRC